MEVVSLFVEIHAMDVVITLVTGSAKVVVRPDVTMDVEILATAHAPVVVLHLLTHKSCYQTKFSIRNYAE